MTEIQNSKHTGSGIDTIIVKFWLLEFWIWILFVIWSLRFGISGPEKRITCIRVKGISPTNNGASV
jgi:hypothetical protein